MRLGSGSSFLVFKQVRNGSYRQSYRCCSTKNGDENKSDAEFPKAYDPSIFEVHWNNRWPLRESLKRPQAPSFRMILPPPNVTGKLHLGHALTLTIQDTIARWKTMQGFNVEWFPGFDHAGIATHTVALRKLNISNKDITSSDVQNKIEEFASANLNCIKDQLQSMGPLLNWESTYYTLDENHSAVVKEAFVYLFEAGLIKRGDGIVNWCCTLQSSVADVEVDCVDFTKLTTLRVPGHEKPIEFGLLYFCEYALENSDESLTIATSRPETMFGDVALAVNPEDSRYAKYIGRKVINPVNQKVLPVIGDKRVKTDFGTGIVKITPSHDKLDFAIGESQNLPKVNIFTPDGYLNETTGKFKGMARFDARASVLDYLENIDALKSIQEYSGAVNICSRTGDVIEPKILPHWFFQTKKFTEQFVSAINRKEFIIFPENHSTDLLHQLASVQDWCLSRQIKWGHEIPIYHHINYPTEWVSALDKNTAKRKIEERYGIKVQDESEIIQDQDVLDTWFSSSLIPVALSGWPDLKTVQEISLMETGNDILLFWVWRMVITTLALTDKFPFNQVLLHGIFCDKYGRKMSKSKGNVIDPIHIIDGMSHEALIEDANNSLNSGELEQQEYDLRISAINSEYPEGFKAFGRDALRFALLSQNIQGEQLNLEISFVESCRHFTNKLWQALRFFSIYQAKLLNPPTMLQPTTVGIESVEDLWLLACLYEFVENCEKYLDEGRFHLYAESIKKFFYQQLCDVYIELIKNDLKTGMKMEQHLLVMQIAFEIGLKLSHPLLPYVTEEMWFRLGQKGLLVDQPYPKAVDLKSFQNEKLNATVLKSIKIIKEIRSLKARIGIKESSKPYMFLDVPSLELPDIGTMKVHIETLGGCKISCDSIPAAEKHNYITIIIQIDGKIYKISTPKGDATAKFLEGEMTKIVKLQVKLEKMKQQYDNPNFQQYASTEVKEKLRKRLKALENQINEVIANSNGSTEDKRTP